MELKHSGLGISSFIISIISGMCLFLLFVIAGVMEASTPGGIDETSPVAVFVGLCLFAFLFLALVAFGLGVAGLIQKDRIKLFAWLGTIFSACSLLGTVTLVLIGLTMNK